LVEAEGPPPALAAAGRRAPTAYQSIRRDGSSREAPEPFARGAGRCETGT